MSKPLRRMSNKIGIASGDKATSDAYDPVDRFMLYASHRMNKLLHDSVPTALAGSKDKPSPIPNLLTLTSWLCAGASVAAVVRERRVQSAALWVCAYYFDCADGNYARRYNSVTTLGDLLDHVGDKAKVVAMMGALWWVNGKSVRDYVADKKIGLFMVAVAFFVCAGSIGCLERRYTSSMPSVEHSQTLQFSKQLCSVSVGGATGCGIVNAIVFPGLFAAQMI